MQQHSVSTNMFRQQQKRQNRGVSVEYTRTRVFVGYTVQSCNVQSEYTW